MLGNSAFVKILAKNETGILNESMKGFYVYKALLQNANPYFKALKNFKEGDEGVVQFKNVDPKAVTEHSR